MLHRLLRTQVLHSDVDTVWEFISQPANLERITPASMKFSVITKANIDKMYPGQIIEYYVNPFKGVKTYWVTEITHVRNKEFFVDEQRFGPYKFWHHQHMLKQTADGVEMTDIVHYKLPFGVLGTIVNKLMVRRKLEHIFNFRRRKLEELFNTPRSSSNTLMSA